MKTAISLPDDTYEQATRQAAELGISRSEFFARAARSYLDQLAAHSLTQQINEALRDRRRRLQRRRCRRWPQLPGRPGRLVTERGSICWADLGEARGSKPAKRRPVLVIQSDPFNASRLNTTIAAVITSKHGPGRHARQRFPARSHLRPAQGLSRQRHRPGHPGQDRP
jgi:hypothetical protein